MVAKKPKSSYYHARDFRIGSFFNVLNRDMLIHDVDDFTRAYYMEHYNMSKEDMEAINVQVQSGLSISFAKVLWTGFLKLCFDPFHFWSTNVGTRPGPCKNGSSSS